MKDLCVSSTVKIMSTVCIISRCIERGICTYVVAPVGTRIGPGRWPLHMFLFHLQNGYYKPIDGVDCKDMSVDTWCGFIETMKW